MRLGIGLTATLAGLDKFFNLLANWSQYVSPLAAQMLPFSTATFMGIVGVVEVAVGIAVLTAWTRLGAYVASAWLILVAVNLAMAGYFDVAVRDVNSGPKKPLSASNRNAAWGSRRLSLAHT